MGQEKWHLSILAGDICPSGGQTFEPFLSWRNIPITLEQPTKAVNLVGCKSLHRQLPGRVVSISDACGGNEAITLIDPGPWPLMLIACYGRVMSYWLGTDWSDGSSKTTGGLSCGVPLMFRNCYMKWVVS